jgi:pimeloyl-ACP methyl ester carboxylesterase
VRRWLARAGAGLLALVALGTVAFVVAPPVRAGGKALAVLARSAGLPFPRPFAHRVEVREVELSPGVVGDLYDPGGGAPAVVLAHGAAPEGKDDPRIERVARSLAGAGRVVFVPDLELRHERFVWGDVDRIVAAAAALAARSPGGTVGLVGVSYGGSFCLLAAEQPAARSLLAFVAVFGSFHDLLGIVQGITTGATTFEGRVVPWETVPEARQIMTEAALGLLDPARRGLVETALARRDRGLLPRSLRPVFDLLTNTDPKRTYRLAERLPRRMREALARFSPATRIDRLDAPLFIMQSRQDPATPPTEALKLHRAVPGSRLVLLRSFRHVEPTSPAALVRTLPDLWGAWRFTSWVLAAQE